MTPRPCNLCGGDLAPLRAKPAQMLRPAMVCLVCDAGDPDLTIATLGGMNTPAPGTP